MRGLKLRYKIPIIIAIVVVLILIMWFLFRIRTITVEGNTFFNESQVAETYQTSFFQKNVLTNLIYDALGFTKDPPYVREAELSYPSFGELHIKLFEKTILAGVKFSRHFIYFDKDGMVLKTTEEELKDIPYFETDDVTDFTLYQTLSTGREELLPQMLNMSSRLTYYKIDWDKAEFDTEGHATLHSGKVTVKLGRRSDYDEVISILPDILSTAKKSGDKGTIDMTNYKAGSTIIFRKDS